MEADLWRSEAKLAALGGISLGGSLNEDEYAGPSKEKKISNELAYVVGPDGQVLPEDEDEIPQSKEEGVERWREAMEMRFLQGRDTDFDYADVDGMEEYDVIERREAEEDWFEEEEPEWVEGVKERGRLESETGIQDF